MLLCVSILFCVPASTVHEYIKECHHKWVFFSISIEMCALLPDTASDFAFSPRCHCAASYPVAPHTKLSLFWPSTFYFFQHPHAFTRAIKITNTHACFLNCDILRYSLRHKCFCSLTNASVNKEESRQPAAAAASQPHELPPYGRRWRSRCETVASEETDAKFYLFIWKHLHVKTVPSNG